MSIQSLTDSEIRQLATCSGVACPDSGGKEQLGISVIVPVYNSENSLPLLVERLQPVLDKLGQPYELILVDDASRDKSWDVVQNLVSRYPWVTGINLMRNYGQHNAVLCGIRAARFSIAVTMDDDLQNP